MKMMRLILCAAFFPLFAPAQNSPVPAPKGKPKLVVGIIVDQMRADYIDKYWSKFGSDGFRRLVEQGFACKNTNYNYVPTYTGPGHASVYTGSTPAVHGIIGNNWYDAKNDKFVYCSEDPSVHAVGGDEKSGQMSPRNLLTTTLGDQLRLSDNKGSKVIGIALKDRGAILPAGHSANAAYWFDGSNGNWITSTYYMQSLPSWVEAFNKKQLAKNYLSQEWNTLLPIAQYTESIADDNKYEGKFSGEIAPVFPHKLPALMAANGGFDLIRTTPFGNSLTREFAVEAIKSENLGKGNFTDMICISFSSTDYVGHMYGPQSIEVEDTYLRLDKEIAELLKFLDGWVGKENVMVFLTADHGAAENAVYLEDQGIPAGLVNSKKIQDSLVHFLYMQYGDSLVKTFINQEVYLDRARMEKKKLNSREVEDKIAAYVMNKKGIAGAVTRTALQNDSFTNGVNHLVQNGFLMERSGDVYVNYEPGWMEYGPTGTTHGSPYTYDTHVPLLWYGWNVKPGSTSQPVEIPDIVATLSMMLNIQVPNGCTGKPVPALVK